MSSIEQRPVEPEIPAIVLEMLEGIDPATAEYKEELLILTELQREDEVKASHRGEVAIQGFQTGTSEAIVVSSEDIAIPETGIPKGYKSSKLLKGAGKLDPKQFAGKIYSFAERSSTEKVDVTELVTENGIKVRVCDLRSNMTSQVRKGGPKASDIGTQKKIDNIFFDDIKKHVEHLSPDHPEKNVGGKHVQGVNGVRYSSDTGSQVRSYWMIVRDENAPEATTVARLADCADGTNFERDLYRRVFNTSLNKK